MTRKFLLALTVLAFGTVASAFGAITYTLNVDYCSTGCLFGGTGGTVTLTDVVGSPGQVEVQVVLNSPPDFHSNPGMGGFDTFAFNLFGSPLITFVTTPTSPTIGTTAGSPGATWAPTAGSTQSAGSHQEDGAGDFMYVVNCTNCGLSSGFIATVETLDFIISASGLSTSSFIKNTNGSPNSYFAVDIFTTSTCTGVIGSDGGTTPTNGGSNTGTGTCGSQVPEPTSVLLFGTMLAIVGKVLKIRLAA